MFSLLDKIKEAEDKKVALAHFNFANIDMFWGIVHAARDLNLPVIVGTSEGERSAIGGAQAVALVKSTREKLNHPIFINADHHHSLESFKEAVDAGYDSAIIDGSGLAFEENIAMTKEAVSYARQQNPNMVVEGEVGRIGSASKLLDEIPEDAELTEDLITTVEQARRFVEETGVDLFSPAVGNLHGILKNAPNPALNIERIKSIHEAVQTPIVLHGGSGVSDSDFVKAIDAGVSEVHISTELRVAYRQTLERSLKDNPDEVAPYNYMPPVIEAVQEVASARMRLFSKIS